MDGVALGCGRGGDERGNAEVALRGERRADVDSPIGEADVETVLVGGGVDGYCLDSELAAGADDADGDLAAVGDQNAREHCFSRAKVVTIFVPHARFAAIP